MDEPMYDPQILNKNYNHNIPKKEKESSLKSIYYAS